MVECDISDKRLVELILKKAFKYSEAPIFTLASGRKTSYYFNCKPVTLDPEGRFCIGEVAHAMLQSTSFQAIGGLTLGADPIAIAVSDVFFRNGKKILSFVVRKEPKKHGTGQWIEGDIPQNTPVIIVEDVITTGQSAIKAIRRAKECGLDVKEVLAFIDREEGGREEILKEGIPVRSMFLRSRLMDDYRRMTEKH